ncbi:hypothetical protein EDB80DRAFT_571219, partial [Ilyonectria destructans]
RLAKIHQYIPAYSIKALQHQKAVPLWRGCRLQMYFTAKGRIDYFIIEGPSSSSASRGEASVLGLLTPPLSQEEGNLFNRLKADINQTSRNLDKNAGAV